MLEFLGLATEPLGKPIPKNNILGSKLGFPRTSHSGADARDFCRSSTRIGALCYYQGKRGNRKTERDSAAERPPRGPIPKSGPSTGHRSGGAGSADFPCPCLTIANFFFGKPIFQNLLYWLAQSAMSFTSRGDARWVVNRVARHQNNSQCLMARIRASIFQGRRFF